MRYESAAAFRQALEARLSERSGRTGEPLGLLRKLVTFDRLLARLVQGTPDRWTLKGALALSYRLETTRRLTKDADLVRYDDEGAATADLLAAQSMELSDHFSFLVEKVESSDESAAGSALRYRARAELAGRPFEEVLVDVGFLDPMRWPTVPAQGPDLLGFAGIDPVTVPTLPLEQQVAEKVHAYTRTHGEGSPSSRVKDLIDLLIVCSTARIDAERLGRALLGTFDARATHPLPDALPKPPRDWAVPFRRLAVEAGLEPDVSKGHARVAAMLNPALAGNAGGQWDPEAGRWL